MKDRKIFETQLPKEFIDSSEQSISNREENRLQQGKTDSFTVSVPKDLDKVQSKSKQQNLYRSDSDEVPRRKNDKTYRFDRIFSIPFQYSIPVSSLEYTSDELSTSEKDQLPLTKSIRPYSNTNIREQTRPQGNAFSSSPTNNKSSYSKPMETDEEEGEDFSLPNQTITSSTSENLSNRQIRPGDRVKNKIKTQPTSRSSKSSIQEADRYRRSMETNQDHRNEPKQPQLISEKHPSQMNFIRSKPLLDEKRTRIVDDDSNQRIEPQRSKEKNLPRKSSSRSLKQRKMPKKSSIEMANDKNRTEENKVLQTQRSSTNRTRNSDHQLREKEQQKINENSKLPTRISSGTKQVSQAKVTDDSTDTSVVSKSRIASNVSQLTKPITTINKERIEPQFAPSKHEQKDVVNPSSNQTMSRTSVDTSKRRSQSALPSRAPSTASKDPFATDVLSSSRLHQTSIGIKTTTDPSTKEKTSPQSRANIPDSTFNEYHSQENTQNISS